MNNQSYEITVDTQKSINHSNIEFSQNNLNISELIFNITEDGKELPLKDTDEIIVYFKKPDKTVVFQDKEIELLDKSKGKVKVLLTTQTLVKAGDVEGEISIGRVDNGMKKRTSTYGFSFKVRSSLASNDSIESTNEFQMFDQLLELGKQDIPAIINSKETAEQALKKSEENANQIGILSENLSGVETQLANKTDKSYVDTKLSSVASGSPKGTYATLAALQTAFPTGNTNIYLVTADGKWYYWNGTAWTAGGTYQSTGIADGTVKVTSTNFLTETNVGNNMLASQTMKTGGYYDPSGAWVADSSFFSIVGYIPVEQNVTYNNVFYNVRCYDANDNLVSSVSNNKAPFIFTDGVTVKIRPNIKTAEATVDNAYMYKLGYKASDLALQDKNMKDGFVTKAKIAQNAVDYDHLTPGIKTYFKKTFDVWEMGYIGSTGTPTASTNNIRTTSYHYLEQGMKITLNEGIDATFRVIAYSLANNIYTFVSRTDVLTEYTIPTSGYYKLQFQKTDLTDIDVSFGKNVYGYFPNLVVSKLSLDAELKNTKVKPKSTEKFMHVSCDDFITPFQDLTTNVATYTGLFDSPTFAFLKSMHDKYGMVFSAYCFYETADASFKLSQVPTKFAKDFRDNSHWLRFGFHSRNANKNYASATSIEAKTDYDLFVSEMIRITGSYKCIDLVPRFHNYAGGLDAMSSWKSTKGAIVGALTAEDTRTNYYHSAKQTNELLANDRMYDANTNLMFFSTDIRLDTATTPKATLEARRTDAAYVGRMNDLIIFLHDPNVANVTYQNRVIECCEFAIENGYRFDFPMNVAMR